jgi:hypothetical protein
MKKIDENITKLDKYTISVSKEKLHHLKGDIYCIDVPIYRCSVHIMFNKTTLELENMWNNDSKYGGQTRNYLNSNRDVLITFPKKNPNLSDVAHEILHACQMIMKSIGHKTDDRDADEPIAYLHTYLFDKYLKIKKIKL